MPVQLTAMSSIIRRGLALVGYKDFKITKSMLKDFPLIAEIVDVVPVCKYKDLLNLPRNMVFSSDGSAKYSISVKTTWEYPQGCGRIQGYDEWPRNKEGKVEIHQDVFNQAYLDLLDEIDRFEDWMMTQSL